MAIRKKLFILVFLGMTTGNAEATVVGPYASAEATFDWSSFSVQAYALGPGAAPSVTWSNQFSSVIAMTQAANVYQSSADWSTSLHKTAGNTATQALAGADATTLHASALVTNSTDYAGATSYRSGGLNVTGNGLLVFSMHYSLDAALVPDASSTFNNSATAGVDFFAQRTGSNAHSEFFSANSALNLNSGNTGTSPVHLTGVLNLALLVSHGDQLDFLADSRASASLGTMQPIMPIGIPVSSVPLPGAVWLFLSAGAGLLSLTRRKSTLSA